MDLNSDLFALHSGTVISVEDSFDPGEYRRRSYGNTITLESELNGNIVIIMYAHLNRVDVQEGYNVSQGQIIGLSGNTGNAVDSETDTTILPHVHIEAKVDGERVDPAEYLATKFDSSTGDVKETCDL